MFDPLISGISFGLLLAVMLGPVFFTLLQTSLHEGFKAGVHLAVGVLISDATLIGVCVFFASQLNLLDQYRITMGWIGGILMIGFGLFNFFRKVVVKEIDLLKSYVAHRIKNLLKPNVMLWINRVIGTVLVGFGVNMILKVINV